MNTAGQKIRKLRGLSHTWRWNFHPRVRQESVAEHSFWVALIVHELMLLKKDDELRKDCVISALYHDMLEAITGDLPSLVKRGHSWTDVEIAAYNEIMGINISIQFADRNVDPYVKMADTVAALLFADEEFRMGNSYFGQIRGELIGVAFGYRDHELNQLLSQLGFRSEEALPLIKEMSHL